MTDAAQTSAPHPDTRPSLPKLGSGAPELVLGSRSPRRRQLLEQLGVACRILPADIAETRTAHESPDQFVQRMAAEKARAVRAKVDDDAIVLGADTDVVLDDVVLGKPTDLEDARFMLRALSDRTHQVMSAISLMQGHRQETRLQVSDVTFGIIDDDMIDAYWATGEPAGKAGAYAIQGLGAAFVAHLDGSFSGVMGLPLYETQRLLNAFGIRTLGQAA